MAAEDMDAPQIKNDEEPITVSDIFAFYRVHRRSEMQKLSELRQQKAIEKEKNNKEAVRALKKEIKSLAQNIRECDAVISAKATEILTEHPHVEEHVPQARLGLVRG